MKQTTINSLKKPQKRPVVKGHSGKRPVVGLKGHSGKRPVVGRPGSHRPLAKGGKNPAPKKRSKLTERKRSDVVFAVGGDKFRCSKKLEKVTQFGNGQVKKCLLVTPPVPVPMEGIDEKNFKEDKKDGRKYPQLIKRLLDELVEKGVVENYMDFFRKYVGSVRSPRTRSLYLVWTAEGFDATKDIWPVPSQSLKYFTITKDASKTVMDHHQGAEMIEAVQTHEWAIPEIREVECLQERTMRKIGEEGLVPFFETFTRDDSDCVLPRIDARAFKGVSEMTKEDVEKKISGGGGSSKKKPSSTPKPAASKPAASKPAASKPAASKPKPMSQEEAVKQHFPSVLASTENAHGKLMQRVCGRKYMATIPFTGSTNEAIVRNIESNWEDSFLTENEDEGNAIMEDGVALVLNSRVNVESLPPFDLGQDPSTCGSYLSGTNPEIKGTSFEDDIDDKDRIKLVRTILSAIAIPVVSSAHENSWFRAQARDIIAKSEVPIDGILSSRSDVTGFLLKDLREDDMMDTMVNLYMQHKFVGMVNGHICT